MKKFFLITLLFPFAVLAADTDYTLVIKDHRFQPNELTVPSGKKLTLLIENQDATPEEFESHALNREKMIAAGGSVKLYIGPLDSGSYTFGGEFHEATAKGTIIVR
ncbi:MAG: cupredoxin domain-containing protein [Gallionella sp.]|nr:cupredoxin domain-containing protein [Gallionella sp.]